MAAETRASLHGSLKVHPSSRMQLMQTRFAEGLRHDISSERAAVKSRYSQAYAINCYAISERYAICHMICTDNKTHRFPLLRDSLQLPNLFN
ncbi:hypothetical protein D3C80_1741870 [compost metagenome]